MANEVSPATEAPTDGAPAMTQANVNATTPEAAAETPPAVETPTFLTPAAKRLEKFPGFSMVGRQEDLRQMHNSLMRKEEKNNVVLVGDFNGVGTSSLVLSMHAATFDVDDETTPLEILDKQLFYLDVNALFSLTDASEITASFKAAMETLRKTPNAILVIEDTNSFLKGIANNRIDSVFNELMDSCGPLSQFQTVFITNQEDKSALVNYHEDVVKLFNLQLVKEPSKEDLRAILEKQAAIIGKKYDLTITMEAIDALLDATDKFPGISGKVGFAQPKCSIEVLESTAVEYVRAAQVAPLGVIELEKTLAIIADAVAGKVTETEADDMSPEELTAAREETEQKISKMKEEWSAKQKEIRKVRRSIAMAESAATQQQLQGIRDLIAREKQKEADIRDTLRKCDGVNGNQEAINNLLAVMKSQYDVDLSYPVSSNSGYANYKDARAIITNEKIRSNQSILDQSTKKISDTKAEYERLKKEALGGGLVMTGEQVLAEFSALSGVPASKLNQDETAKLLHLAETIKERVFGQDEPVEAVADAVISSKAGLKGPNEPIGCFMFIGPSGVGKTELAKALAVALFDEEAALDVYDMSTYKQDTAINTLIGSPPGYEGTEKGGILTNSVHDRPFGVRLFDEVEKSNLDIRDILLRACDEGLLEDRRGMEVSFGNSVIILTSNVGATHFLNEESFEVATEKALEELWDYEKSGFKPEFLNRLTIFCFNKLGQAQIVRIADKNIKGLNNFAADKGIEIKMSPEAVQAMCEQQYDEKNGGRGIKSYINRTVRKDTAKAILSHPGKPGIVEAAYVPGVPTKEEIANIEETVRAFAPSARREAEIELKKTFEGDIASDDFKKKVAEVAEKKLADKIQERVVQLGRSKAKITAVFNPKAAPDAAASQPAANQNVARAAVKAPSVG